MGIEMAVKPIIHEIPGIGRQTVFLFGNAIAFFDLLEEKGLIGYRLDNQQLPIGIKRNKTK